MQQLRSVVLTTNDCFKVCQQANQIARIERTGSEVTDNELKRLKASLVTVGGLKVKAVDEPDLFPIQLSMFINLIELELFECPPTCITDFHSLRPRLARLKVERAWIPYIKRLLAPPSIQLPEQAPMTVAQPAKDYKPLDEEWKWQKLNWLSLSSCSIDVLDEGVHLLNNVQSVDLSRNQIREVRHLQDCYRLERLDLSYNRLSDVQSVFRVLGNIRHLVLARNQISSTKGLDKLFALISLDLGWNYIADYLEVSRLAKLPCLESLRLEGNPIYEKEGYRVHVFGLFMRGVRGDTDPPMLDGERPSESELCNLPSVDQFTPETMRGSMSSMSRFLTDLRQPSVNDFSFRQSTTRAPSALFRNPLSDDNSAGLSSEQFPPATYGQSTAGARLQVSTGTATDEQVTSNVAMTGKRRAEVVEVEDLSMELTQPRTNTPYFIISPQPSPKVEERKAEESLTAPPENNASTTATAESEAPRTATRVKSFRAEAQAAQPAESPSLEDSRKARTARRSQYKSKMAELRDSMEILSRGSADLTAVAAAAAAAAAAPDELDGDSEHADRNSNSQSNNSELGDDAQAVVYDELGADAEPAVEPQIGSTSQPTTVAAHENVSSPVTEAVDLEESSNSQNIEPTNDEDAAQHEGDHTSAVSASPSRFSASVFSGQETKEEIAPPFDDDSEDEVAADEFGEDQSRSSYDGDNSMHERSAIVSIGRGDSKIRLPAFDRGTSGDVVASSYKSDSSGSHGHAAHAVLGTSLNTPSITSTSPDTEDGFSRLYSERGLSVQVPTTETSRESYAGDSDYAELSVADNLELYFKEQVWPMRSRGSGLPYLAQAPGGFYEPPTTPETFVLLFREKLCFVRQNVSSDATNAAGQHAKEEPVLIAITDSQVYIILDRFAPTERFNDTPRPLVLRQHPLLDLQRVVISFGFQRVNLEFAVDPAMWSRLAIVSSTVSYALITRDKPRTYAIISKVPPMANELRLRAEPPRNKTRIENSDRQLLDETSKIEGTVSDIVHYQLLFQRWKRRPGETAPRSLILTSEHLFLCEEDFSLPNVVLRLVDKAKIHDVLKIRSEDNPLHLTFILKPTSVFGPRRKWRLVASLRTAIEKLRTEARRLCPQAAS